MAAWLCTAASAQNNVVTEAWETLNLRRTPAIRLDEFGYGDTFSPLTLLKLTDDSVVVTFEGSPPNKKPLFLLGELCDAEGGGWVSDATLLRPDETPEEFVETNQQFLLPEADNVRFAQCMPQGMGMTMERKVPGFFVFSSEERVIAHLNRWAWFLAGYRVEAGRAGAFLNRSLTMQIDILVPLIASPEVQDLHAKLSYFDRDKAMTGFEREVAMPQIDMSILRRYFELTTRARRKLLVFYPEHRERLEHDRMILERLGGSPNR
jgi:hypothetical protein